MGALWRFFRHTFIQEAGELILSPHNWPFDESFKDNLSIRSFASVCQSIRVSVDPIKNTIVHIHIR